MTSAGGATGRIGPHPVRDAVHAGDYERAALRLLYGFLHALDETAPEARDELLHLMVERRLPRIDHGPADRGWRGRIGGHR